MSFLGIWTPELRGFPENEDALVRKLLIHLSQLIMHVENFYHAAALMEIAADQMRNPTPSGYAKELNRLGSDISRQRLSWIMMAARHGAFVLWDLHRELGITKGLVERASESVRAFVNTSELDGTMKQFQKDFPRTKDIRDAAGHPVDWLSDAKWHSSETNFEKNSAKAIETPAMSIDHGGISCTVEGLTVHYTAGHEHLKFDMTADSVNKLAAIVKRFYAAFAPATRDASTTPSEKSPQP